MDDASILIFEHWSRMPYWSASEAVALMFGMEPFDDNSSLESCRQERDRMAELCKRAVASGHLHDPMEPSQFLNWAGTNEIAVPKKLVALVEKRHRAKLNWEQIAKDALEKERLASDSFDFYRRLAERKEDEITRLHEVIRLYNQERQGSQAVKASSSAQRSMNTLLKLVGGIAIAVYNYNPDDKKSDVVAQIQNDLDLKGVSLDADTIRKWIREGTKLVMPACSKA